MNFQRLTAIEKQTIEEQKRYYTRAAVWRLERCPRWRADGC